MSRNDTTQVLLDIAAQRRFERDLLRREVALCRAYTIARHACTKSRAQYIPLTMQLWEMFSPDH